jgi:hypothetical protein
MGKGYFECCHNCKPPRRYPGCQDHCPDYAEGKAKHDADKEIEYQRRRREAALYLQTCEGVRRATKNRRKKGVQYE